MHGILAFTTAVLRDLHHLLRAALLKSLHFRWVMRAVSSRMYIYPNTYVFASRTARVVCRGQLRFGMPWPDQRLYPSQLHCGENCDVQVEGHFQFFTGCSVIVGAGAILRLGSGYMNSHCTLECVQEIRIGDDVLIGPRVVITDSDYHTVGSSPKTIPITIGDRVWIGDGVKILKGVRVGEGAVIAAGAVVTRDVPAHALVGGVPAKVLRANVKWH